MVSQEKWVLRVSKVCQDLKDLGVLREMVVLPERMVFLEMVVPSVTLVFLESLVFRVL